MGLVGILCILAGTAVLFGVHGTPFALILVLVGLLALVINVAEHTNDDDHHHKLLP